MALKTWVTARTPRSNAACASDAVAFVWPSETTTPLACKIDEVERAGKLRRERHEPDRPGRKEALEQRRVGIAPSGESVCPEPGGGEERPFQVHAQDARAGGMLRDRGERGDEIALL